MKALQSGVICFYRLEIKLRALDKLKTKFPNTTEIRFQPFIGFIFFSVLRHILNKLPRLALNL